MTATTRPVLPLRGLVIYPKALQTIHIGRASSRAALQRHQKDGTPLVAIPQSWPDCDDPTATPYPTTGVLLRVIQIVEFPDGQQRVLVEGISRIQRTSDITIDPVDGATIGTFKPASSKPIKASPLLLAQARALHATLTQFLAYRDVQNDESEVILGPYTALVELADKAAAILPMAWSEQLQLLDTAAISDRLDWLLTLAISTIKEREVTEDINAKVHFQLELTNRQYQIREQIKALQAQLGTAGASDIVSLGQLLQRPAIPDEVRKVATEEYERLQRMSPESAEYQISRTWLETLCRLPWGQYSQDDADLEHASSILNEDHFGLDEVKERILEYLAVRQLRSDTQGGILCFAGAPGVGKTSLGRSIARALGRTSARVSLGGIKDESEVRGHRRTYVGAMPGRIVAALQRAGTANPVIILDEIDKVGSDYRGDPASALLEVLDPEQNKAFTDHYLDVPIDLSSVLFIATANLIDPIPAALRDRFEIIEIPGYTEEEKTSIATRFLLPRQVQEHGLTPAQITVSEATIFRILADYTREAGVRHLNRQLARLCRKAAHKIVNAQGKLPPIDVTPDTLDTWLGPPRYFLDIDDRDDTPGVAVGLAWTEVGGDILFIESLVMPGQASLKLTGSLGEVMKESAEAALSWLRTHADKLELTPQDFAAHIHLHVPAGAIPKDGPSAGVSMICSIASCLTGRAVRAGLAMTGEITLRGKILPVGGIKEKVLAARRAGVREVILPRHNAKDLVDIAPEAQADLHFHFVDTIDEVLAYALTSPKENRPPQDPPK